ncbi:M4 family metallopeptidase [Sphingomonas profundi]|uniref:M4 family metallopeptidase n=1 Tax=Alterirhizorhabdus profundi TaxID=2681549 RepID=UPI0012E90F8B|nr:M4 family metallopeptidase [Sphingomonas profundi]
MACRCLNCIVPPHMLRRLLDCREESVRQAALATLLATERLRGARMVRALGGATPGAPAGGRRTVYDCRNATDLSLAVIARTEEQPDTTDTAVNHAFDGLGATRDFYATVLSRDSIDDKGMRLDGYVHRGTKYNNAFWDGQEMVFGDGDGVIFTNFTGSLDVIGHELTHGVTQFVAGLEYHDQPGALNESISDVFGSLVKQWKNGQAADQADWLIGPDIFTPDVAGDALRSMKAPGTAYDDPRLGKDPQPADMAHYVKLPNTDEGDNGGVHINSGIPNRAFYLTATGIGGNAWEAPGHIWYEALAASNPKTEFQDFADTTYTKATQLHGTGSPAQQAVLDAWAQVGIRISSAVIAGSDGDRPPGDDGGRSFAELSRQIAGLSEAVGALAGAVAKIRP